jgi:hypothetical protein
MKSIFKLIIFSFPFLIFILACNKNNNSSRVNSLITLSKPNIKRGEQLFATTNTGNSNSIIKWTVKPSAYVQVLPANSHATAIFALAGTYQITASYYSASDTSVAYDSSRASIIVTDSIFSASPLIGSNTDTVTLEGDQIILSPIIASGDSGFIMSAQTINLYNCSAYITAYSWGYGLNQSLFFLFNSAEVVDSKSNCDGIRNPAISYLFFTPGFFTPLSNGTYSLSANLNQVDYYGSLTVTDTDYIFTWNYTSGIIISPLHIKKN